jgi:hypothetical protein
MGESTISEAHIKKIRNQLTGRVWKKIPIKSPKFPKDKIQYSLPLQGGSGLVKG